MLVPPEKNSASTTLIRLPPRISFVVTSTGVWMFGSRNMSTVSRAGTNSGAPCCSSMTWANSPMTTRPCIEFGSHGPFETGLGMKVFSRLAKKGWFVMAGAHDGKRAMKSRASRAILPFAANGFVGLGVDGARRQCGKLIPRHQLRQRPHRRATHQRACVTEQALGFISQRRVVGVAEAIGSCG